MVSDCQVEIEDLKDQLFTAKEEIECLKERVGAIILQRDKLFAAYIEEIERLKKGTVLPLLGGS